MSVYWLWTYLSVPNYRSPGNGCTVGEMIWKKEGMCCVMNVKEVGKVREQLVARRFREYRVTRHLTQKEVAPAIGCNLLTYCGYEHGTSFPRLETLIRLADLYGVSLDVLLCRNQIFRFKEF